MTRRECQKTLRICGRRGTIEKATAVRRGDLKLRRESGVETISYGR